VEAFDFMDELVGKGSASYHTAGSLHGGRRVWILAQMPKCIHVTDQDIIGSFLLLANAHDGSLSITVKHTNIRVVCANTLELSLEEANLPMFKVLHTESMAGKIEKAKEILLLSEKRLRDNLVTIKSLQRQKFTTEKFKKYLEALLPDNPEATRNTRISNIRQRIVELWEGDGKGIDISGVRGTGWAAYNSVVEYLDWIRGRNKDNRMSSSWFGEGRKTKERALALALAA
jgi:phage/plasmid-like protein (TIGR03299 family)